MSNLITAQEARVISGRNEFNHLKEELDSLMELIRGRTLGGKYTLEVERLIMKENISALKRLGYKVKKTPSDSASFVFSGYEIKW
jgi:hypothetical protein